MSFMFEVFYRPPANPVKETAVTNRVALLGGRLDYREAGSEHSGVCLTYEFDDREKAEQAANELRLVGEHVEGPVDYAE